MPEFSLVTINILVDLSRWNQRRELLLNQIAELSPDLIALQEVSLLGNSSNAHWLAENLNFPLSEDQPQYQVYLSPRSGLSKKGESLAILSRLPVKRQENLDLRTQNRVAKLVELRVEESRVMLVNGHFFWQPGPSKARQAQIELLLDWLDTQPAEIPVVVCGDFNSTPDHPAILRMREYFVSAHRSVYGEEPEYTCPTPLEPSFSAKLRIALGKALKPKFSSDPNWAGTLDYIFVDPRLQVEECRVVLNQPDSKNPNIYPSDHFGLYALIKVN